MFDDNDFFIIPFEDSFSSMDDDLSNSFDNTTHSIEDSLCMTETHSAIDNDIVSDSLSNNLLEEHNTIHHDIEEPWINCANGLPMFGTLDVEGNPYGADDNRLRLETESALTCGLSNQSMPCGSTETVNWDIDINGNPYGKNSPGFDFEDDDTLYLKRWLD